MPMDLCRIIAACLPLPHPNKHLWLVLVVKFYRDSTGIFSKTSANWFIREKKRKSISFTCTSYKELALFEIWIVEMNRSSNFSVRFCLYLQHWRLPPTSCRDGPVAWKVCLLFLTYGTVRMFQSQSESFKRTSTRRIKLHKTLLW